MSSGRDLRHRLLYCIGLSVLCTSLAVEWSYGQSVVFEMNVFPETESWEIVGHVEGDDHDGLAAYFVKLLDNVTWIEQTAPVIRGTSVGDIGFDFARSISFPTHFELVSGQSNLFNGADGVLFDVGKIAGGNASGGDATNVPWGLPVVLAVGGYDSSKGEIDFSDDVEETSDANLILRDDARGFLIIRADGSTNVPPDDSEGGELLLGLGSPDLSAFLDFQAGNSQVAAMMDGGRDPLDLIFSQNLIAGRNGPGENEVGQWLDTRGVPEPATLALLCFGLVSLSAARRRS